MPPTAVSPAFLVSVIGLAYFVAVLVQLTKFLLDRISPPASANHAAIVRLYVFVVAAVVVCGAAFLSSGLQSRADVLAAAADTINVAGLAILNYHLLSSDSSLPTPPSAVPDAPPPTP